MNQDFEDSEDETEFEPESFDGLAGPRWLQPLWKLMLLFGIPPALGLVFFFVACAVTAVHYFAGLPMVSQRATVTERHLETPPELSVDDQISQLEFSNSNGRYYIISDEIIARRQRINLVSERSDLSVPQRSKLARIALRNEQILIESQLRDAECRDEDLTSFEAVAKSYISEDDQSLSELAYFALARVRTLMFCKKPNKSYGDHLVLGLREFSPGFQNDLIRISYLLERLMQAKQQDPKNPNIDHVIIALGSLLAENQNASIKKLATAIAEDSRFLGLQLWDLNERIRNGEHDSVRNLRHVLRELENNPEIDIKKWTLIAKSCESLLSVGEYEEFESARDSISEMVDRLPDSCDFKPKLAAQIALQKNRFELLGTQVELPKKSLSNRQLEVKNQNVLLVFLNRNPASADLVLELKGQSLDSYQPILIYQDDFTEADLEAVSFMPIGIIVAAYEPGSKLIKSCSIDQYPYTIAVNKRGTIVGVNLSLWQAAVANTYEATTPRPR